MDSVRYGHQGESFAEKGYDKTTVDEIVRRAGAAKVLSTITLRVKRS